MPLHIKNGRPICYTIVMANTTPEQESPQSPQRSVATLVTRGLIVLVALGTLAIIMIGVLLPGTPARLPGPGTGSSTHNGSGPPVGLEVGNAAPNFTLNAPGGARISLSDYRGRSVLLNFWYATCPGCLAEIPGMQRFYAARHAAGKDSVILGVNVLDDAQTATSFAQARHLTYPIVLDQNQQVETLYNVTATPTSYFIDRQGIIRLRVVGPLDETTLSQNLP